MNWFKKLFKREQNFSEQVTNAANKLEPGPAWVHISKLKKAENIIIILKAHNKELSKLLADLAPKKAGWPKGKPRKNHE